MLIGTPLLIVKTNNNIVSHSNWVRLCLLVAQIECSFIAPFVGSQLKDELFRVTSFAFTGQRNLLKGFLSPLKVVSSLQDKCFFKNVTTSSTFRSFST
jgi:hypothetical protein